jgi:hypothetical protein
MEIISPFNQETCLNSFIIQNMDATTIRGKKALSILYCTFKLKEAFVIQKHY